MTRSKIKNHLPDYIGTFKSLTHLCVLRFENNHFDLTLFRSLNACRIYGTIPPSIGDLINLTHLLVIIY